VVAYVKQAMIHSATGTGENEHEPMARCRNPDHVRWRADRGVWLAERSAGNDKMRTVKHFKPSDVNSEESTQAAKTLALKWAASQEPVHADS